MFKKTCLSALVEPRRSSWHSLFTGLLFGTCQKSWSHLMVFLRSLPRDVHMLGTGWWKWLACSDCTLFCWPYFLQRLLTIFPRARDHSPWCELKRSHSSGDWVSAVVAGGSRGDAWKVRNVLGVFYKRIKAAVANHVMFAGDCFLPQKWNRPNTRG